MVPKTAYQTLAHGAANDRNPRFMTTFCASSIDQDGLQTNQHSLATWLQKWRDYQTIVSLYLMRVLRQ